jgi:hypothetical protein
MKTYKLELTAEQLKLVSTALMAYEQLSIENPNVFMEGFGETFMKVSDQLQEYYEDNGIYE